MINKASILVVVPARAGSKGIPNKNIRMILGKPLLLYTLEFIRTLDFVDFIHVSSDSEKILEIASPFTSENTILRPENLSGDLVSDISVLRHSITEIERIHRSVFDYVIMFQPTSPIRNFKFIMKSIKYLTENNFDSVISVKPVDLKFHPVKQFVIESNKIQFFDTEGKKIVARQQLKQTYIRDGVFYGFKRNFIFRNNNVIGSNSSYIVNKNYSINIDSIDDLLEFENYLTKI
jgi:CMP-N,N'-diacetyllegionaminic acid synthase